MNDITKLSDNELRELKEIVAKEISKRYKEKMTPRVRKCKDCEYCKYLVTKEEQAKYKKQPWNKNTRGPFCFCEHPNGKLIPYGHTTPSWCKKDKKEA